ncbi:MAG: adenylosuccinate synthetase, partial [Candidatus Woesearchaeota archaeon]|nr:adenylosuccinate synthetase [Candidatus Woesearchaeota archaeon]
MGLPYFNHHQIAAVIDLSFGDSGKGKIVDLLCEDASLNVRGTGGANAGHTMNVMGHEIITHLVPAGI